MDNNKVLLIAPNFIDKWRKLVFQSKENIGLGYIASFLLEKGYSVDIINASTYNYDNEQIIENVQNKLSNYLIIGISCSSQKMYPIAKDLAKKLKDKGVKHICFGGIFSTLEYENILNDAPFIDYVVLGEGELAFYRLCESIKNNTGSFDRISGFAYRNNNKIIKTQQERIIDLSALPHPIRNKDDLDNINPRFFYIVAGRGCYGNCSFCSSQNCFNYKHKVYRNVFDIIQEIKSLITKYGISYFRFQDDIFFDKSKKSREWVEQLTYELNKQNVNITFRIYLRTNDVDEDMITKLKRVGLIEVFLGVETGIDRLLTEMNKRCNTNDTYRAINILEKNDIDIEIGFITIIPTMTFQELKDNYEFLFNIGHYDESNLHNRLNVFTGCSYIDILTKKGLLLPKENFWDRQDYKFSDYRVAMFHDNLQIVKVYADGIKERIVKIKKEELLFLQEINKELDLKYLLLWKQIIKKLLNIIEKTNENEELELSEIFTMFDNFATQTINS